MTRGRDGLPPSVRSGNLIMMAFERITSDPLLMGGRASIRGMRITVAQVVNLVANGMLVDDILREYPDLEADDVRQALQYAASLANEEIRPLGPAGA